MRRSWDSDSLAGLDLFGKGVTVLGQMGIALEPRIW